MERRGYMCSFRMPDPNSGELHIQMMTQVGFTPYARNDFSVTFSFNTQRELASPETALSLFTTTLTPQFGSDPEFGGEIAQSVATIAFNDARNCGWRHGLFILLVVENIHIGQGEGPLAEFEEDYPSSPAALLDISAVEDAVVQSFALLQMDSNERDGGGEDDSAPVGLSEDDISMLKTEQLDGDDVDEMCPVCLEEFTAGAVITPLTPCSHKFHNLCIAKWLRKNRTCPICRSICTVV